MIDYLAELLAEEEEEAILLGRQVTVRKHRVIPAEEDGERGEQPGKHNARLEDGTERMEPLEEQEETLVNGVRALEGPMEKAADWIETARKNGNAGEQLYAALHRAARGASAAQGAEPPGLR